MAVPVIKSVEAAAKIKSRMTYSLFLVFEDPAFKILQRRFHSRQKIEPRPGKLSIAGA
jgi:hypothetical protein